MPRSELSPVRTADGLPIAHEVHPGNPAEASTLLPMIRTLLARWPPRPVVLVADRGLLSLNYLQEMGKLQEELMRAGRDVRLQYVLAVPAARYGEFANELQALEAQQDSATPWIAETNWMATQTYAPQPTNSYRLVVAHDPEAAQRRTPARRKQIDELIALGEQWGGHLDAQDHGQRR